jgi:hypothetical protein
MNDVVFSCNTKATDKEGDSFRISRNWYVAELDELRLTTRRIECGYWTIRYSEIDDAVLLAIYPAWILGYVLRVKSRGKTYQFRILSTSHWWWVLDPFWLGETPLPMRREVANLDWQGSKEWIRFSFLLVYAAIAAIILIQILALWISGV